MSQIDIGNAFLYGTLDERIVMLHLQGIINKNNSSKVCLLKKAIYKVKKSSHIWFRWLHDFLNSIGFTLSLTDPSLFVFNWTHVIYILVYVDDMVIIGSNEGVVKEVLNKMKIEFTVWDLGTINYFLGIHVCYSDGHLFLDQ